MKMILRLLIRIFVAFTCLSVAGVALYRFMPVYITPLMVIRAISPKGTDAQRQAERHWSHRWVSLDDMSVWMPRAVVASEDAHFYTHHGFDFAEISRAIDENRSGKRNRGASTITQQTAKNVFLWPGHSWVRKGLEAWFTVLIELMWSKDRIMEVYLNSIEMGAGIYGVSAAANHYFHADPSRLSKRQCALIAVCLPSPLKRNPASPSPYISRRAGTIMKYM